MSNGSKINLLQMQDYFEGQMDNIHTLSDLELSENDYRSLGVKLKAFSFFTGSDNDIEDYMLSIAIFSTYTLIYGSNMEDFDAMLRLLLTKSPHAERLRLNMYKDIFYTYGLNTYDITGKDLKNICQRLTARHAGVPNVEKNIFYDIVSCNLECNDVDTLYENIYKELPKRTKFIFDLMDKDMQINMILEARTIVGEVIDSSYTREELIERHKNMSVSLIDRCIMWNENNNQQIRFGIN